MGAGEDALLTLCRTLPAGTELLGAWVGWGQYHKTHLLDWCLEQVRGVLRCFKHGVQFGQLMPGVW